jgi:hypothetical protein
MAIGGYCPEFRCSQDYDFFWRLSERGGAFNLDAPLYHYRYSVGSISAGKALEQGVAHIAAKALALARRQELSVDPSQALQVARRELAQAGPAYRALLKQADHMMLAGAYRKAARAYLNLLREHPRNPLVWAKIARLGIFVALPPAREVCFR